MGHDRHDASEVERILSTIKRHIGREDKMSIVQAETRIWFEQRLAYLREEYREAINRSDTIGKQWLFNQCPKLRLRYYDEPSRKALEAAGFDNFSDYRPDVLGDHLPSR